MVFLIYLVVAGCGLVGGLIMAVSPSKFRRITNRIGGFDRFSLPNPDWRPGIEVQRRAAGAIIAAVALLMLWPAIRMVVFGRVPTAFTVPAPVHPARGPDWYSLGVGVVVLVSGIYAALCPSRVARWAASTMPNRKFTDHSVQKAVWGIRIGGGLAILASLSALVAGLRSLR